MTRGGSRGASPTTPTTLCSATRTLSTAGTHCAWCSGPLPPSKYRPRKWCGDPCRRGLIHAKRELALLEAELAETRFRLASGWLMVNRGHVEGLERDVEAAREGIPEEFR
jgi:hypothetical protein